MKFLKVLTLFSLIAMCLNIGANAQAKKKKTVKKRTKTKVVKPVSEKPQMPVKEDFRIIAEGTNSKFDEPFLYIVRDEKTYNILQTSVENLPEISTIDFTKEAVVAAFSGNKPSSGFTVQIRRSAEKIVVTSGEPAKDSLVATVITTPFKIAVVPVAEESPLRIEISENWTKKMTEFQLMRGSYFSYAGGLAFRERKFDAEGVINVLTYGNLITFTFNLTAKGDKNLMLSETASGSINDGKVLLNRLDTGTFSEMPRPSLKVSGKISETKISLKFEPNPTNFSDGFEARGTIEAIKNKAEK